MPVSNLLGKFITKAAKTDKFLAREAEHLSMVAETQRMKNDELKSLTSKGNKEEKYYAAQELERREVARELKSQLSKGEINKNQFEYRMSNRGGKAQSSGNMREEMQSSMDRLKGDDEYAKGGMVRNKGIGASMKPHNVFNSKKKK